MGSPHVHHGNIQLFSIGVLFLSMMVAVPSAIKIFNWSATMYKGSISFDTPMLYALGFIGLFTMGGLTGVFLASLGMDIHLTETYFIVAHFHYVMVGGMVSAVMAGLHFYWPKMTGRMYPESLGKLAAVILFIGFNLTFFPSSSWVFRHASALSCVSAGVSGFECSFDCGRFHSCHRLSAASALFLWSLKYGKIAGANPWQAAGLEWTVQSPPLTENFAETPIVDFEAYDYGGLLLALKWLLMTASTIVRLACLLRWYGFSLEVRRNSLNGSRRRVGNVIADMSG